MTKEEVQAKSQEKVKAVTTLCESLKLVASAEQMITEGGIIKQVVYYTDIEKYDLDKEPGKEPDGLKKAEEKPAESPVTEPTGPTAPAEPVAEAENGAEKVIEP